MRITLNCPLDLHFNSIKVQLERAQYGDESAVSVFQFHKGTIRTR